jgi:competence protein ComFC
VGIANALLDLIAAPHCVGCGGSEGPLCAGCRRMLAPPRGAAVIPRVARVVASWEYDGPARDLVLALKLRGLTAALAPLVGGMAAAVRRHGVGAEVLTWVPGRPADTRRRGFDHAGVLARSLGAVLGLPVAPLLRRTGVRPDQTQLSATERRCNLRGAFAAAPCFGVVGLVDDVITTGATAEACARALRAAGASEVEVIAACRSS